MKRLAGLWLIFCMALALGGCRPEKPGDFAIYLLAEDVASSQLAKLDLNQLSLQKQPVLTSQDIIAYSPATHEIELTEAAYRRVQQLFSIPVKVSGIPFVVCVGSERIYAGAFWTPASSLSFDGVIILQPIAPDQRTIGIELGYPSPDAFTGKDPRSNPKILQSLQASGKLK